MLQGLQTPDHRLDAGAHLLVLVHEGRTLAGERLVTCAQCAILLPQVFERAEELIDPFCEARELEIKLCFCTVAHRNTIEPRSRRGQLCTQIYNEPAMILADYHHIQQLLLQERSLADAAEAHGTLTGCLCALPGYRVQDWLREILPEGRAAPLTTAALEELFTATAAALVQPDMEFELLLPADEQPIEVRTAALAQWCQGFLYGLGAGAVPDASELPGEVGEVVRDFIEISRAGVDAAQDEESNEAAYAELVEFVRVGVQLLFEELGVLRPPATSAATPLH